MAWGWFFPAEKMLPAKIGFVFGEFSLESQATAQSHGTDKTQSVLRKVAPLFELSPLSTSLRSIGGA